MSNVFHYTTSENQAAEDGLISLSFAGRPLSDLLREVKTLYQEDSRPWVIGFSGGKDSTAVLQLVYAVLLALPPEQRTKPVFVVSSDTRVETPVVVELLTQTLAELSKKAALESIPLTTHTVKPEVDQSFWVNLLGKGYAAPTKAFRWCTERMKINPINTFIVDKVAKYGEVVVILGARKAESSTRAQVIAKHRIDGSRLGKHTSLPNAYVYTPIDDWTADEVWEYLMSGPRPWGGSNRSLLELYKGSNEGECPIVIDTSTPSCGNSRFGCWTCTVVTEDKAMASLVEQGEDWMKPLLDFRNLLAETTKPERKSEFRNFRRRTGKVTIARKGLQVDENGNSIKKYVPGPYWMRYRREWFKQILTLQRDLHERGHEVELISEEEIHTIRREWLNDPNEPDWEDQVPAIYRRVYGQELDWVQKDSGAFSKVDAELLEELGAKYGVPGALVQKLLDLTVSMDGLAKRRGLSDRIHSMLSQDWGELETILHSDEDTPDSGYQEEIDRLNDALAELKNDSIR